MGATEVPTLAITFVAFTAIWLIHVPLRDAGVVDYYWGPGFAVIGWAGLYLSQASDPGKIVFITAVTIWSVRLAAQLIARHIGMGEEDARYATMRRNGGPSWWWQSYFKVFVLQALILWIVASPVHVVLDMPDRATADAPGALAAAGLTGLGLVGYVVFVAGLLIETLADAQLARHRKTRVNRQATLETGLWALSRHPNYLGEVILWFGLALSAYHLTGSLVAFAGPAVLFAVIRFVSLPLTEKHLKSSRADYADYARRVPPFLPLGMPSGATRTDPAK